MNQYFRDLPLKKKFMLLRLSILLTLSIVLAILFVTFNRLSTSQHVLENLHEVRASLYNLRVSLNAQRGEVLINAVANSNFEKAALIESQRSYKNQRTILDTLVTHIERRIAESENSQLSSSYRQLLSTLTPLTSLMDTKMAMFGRSRAEQNDSILQAGVNKFIKDYDPLFLNFRRNVQQILTETENATHAAREHYASIESQTTVILVCFFLFAGAVIYFFCVFIGRIISKPILVTKETLSKISEGQLPKVNAHISKDETGQMLASLQTLVQNLNRLRQFTVEVGQGQFETSTEVFRNRGDIAQSLLLMRSNLKAAYIKEYQDKWTSQGLNEIARIVRSNQSDENMFYDQVLRFFVQYLNANQGTFFIACGEGSEKYLQLVSCFAYEKKKARSGRVNVGEGIVGQVYLEKELNYITKLPKDYIKITSGLGEATPEALAVIPLIHNDNVEGVLEVASFAPFEKYQLDFMNRFASLVAVEIVHSKISIQTKSLLEQSQQQTEELKAQEEELRQSIEELQSTQEEVARRTAEVEGAVTAMKDCGILSAEFDLDGYIISADEKFLETFGYTIEELRGKHYRIFFSGNARLLDAEAKIWDGLKKGQSHRGIYERISKNKSHIQLKGGYAVVRDSKQRPYKIAYFATELDRSASREGQIVVPELVK